MGCASWQPHSSSGRARSRRLTPATIAASCWAVVVSCARLPRMPVRRGPRADPPGPQGLQILVPPPPEVVRHPRCLPVGQSAGGPRGRRRAGVPAAAPPTAAASPSLFRRRCSGSRLLPQLCVWSQFPQKGTGRIGLLVLLLSKILVKRGPGLFEAYFSQARGEALDCGRRSREEKPGLGSGSWGLSWRRAPLEMLGVARDPATRRLCGLVTFSEPLITGKWG